MKKTLLLSSFFLLLVFVPHTLADTGFVPLAPIPGLTDTGLIDTASGVGPGSFAFFFNNLYKFMLGLAIALAIIEIIWGGLEISTQDSVSKKSDGKQRIYNAIYGLILILSPVLVFSIINPCILNLSIALTPIGAPPAAGNQCGQ